MDATKRKYFTVRWRWAFDSDVRLFASEPWCQCQRVTALLATGAQDLFSFPPHLSVQEIDRCTAEMLKIVAQRCTVEMVKSYDKSNLLN